MDLPKWEITAERDTHFGDGLTVWTDRLAVLGGWLYRSNTQDNAAGTLAFVPDAHAKHVVAEEEARRIAEEARYEARTAAIAAKAAK